MFRPGAILVTLLLALEFDKVLSQPDTPFLSTEYGPPGISVGEQQPSKSDVPGGGSNNTIPPSPSVMYGPPGFIPGEPLGEDYSSSSSANTNIIRFGEGGGGCRNTNLEANKKLVMDFYQEVFGNKKFDLLDQYIAEDVINHNPMEADGRESLRKVLEGPLGQGPPMKIDFRHVSAEGDLVWTHLRFPAPALGVTYAIIDIFRISCEGLIAEHWDVIQDTNVKSENPHPFF